MTLQEFLLTKTRVGDVVIFTECGWQVGCTRIDNEDLFIRSLDDRLLLREVHRSYYEKRDWLIKEALIVELLY